MREAAFLALVVFFRRVSRCQKKKKNHIARIHRSFQSRDLSPFTFARSTLVKTRAFSERRREPQAVREADGETLRSRDARNGAARLSRAFLRGFSTTTTTTTLVIRTVSKTQTAHGRLGPTFINVA